MPDTCQGHHGYSESRDDPGSKPTPVSHQIHSLQSRNAIDIC